MGVLVYLSYCAMSWFVMRGTMAYYGNNYGWAAWFANDIWAFFIGGIVPFALYEFLTWFSFHLLVVKVGMGATNIRYGLNIAVIAANLVLFGLKFIYIAFPLQAIIINIILDPAVTLLFVGLYLWYAFGREYVDKSRYRFVISQVMGLFTLVYGVLALINFIMTVV